MSEADVAPGQVWRGCTLSRGADRDYALVTEVDLLRRRAVLLVAPGDAGILAGFVPGVSFQRIGEKGEKTRYHVGWDPGIGTDHAVVALFEHQRGGDIACLAEERASGGEAEISRAQKELLALAARLDRSREGTASQVHEARKERRFRIRDLTLRVNGQEIKPTAGFSLIVPGKGLELRPEGATSIGGDPELCRGSCGQRKRLGAFWTCCHCARRSRDLVLRGMRECRGRCGAWADLPGNWICSEACRVRSNVAARPAIGSPLRRWLREERLADRFLRQQEDAAEQARSSDLVELVRTASYIGRQEKCFPGLTTLTRPPRRSHVAPPAFRPIAAGDYAPCPSCGRLRPCGVECDVHAEVRALLDETDVVGGRR